MGQSRPRGIAVVDVGYTNTKIALFSPEGEVLAERKAQSRHVPGPPYLWIDPEPMVALCRSALPELDAILPIDAVVPTAHGAAITQPFFRLLAPEATDPGQITQWMQPDGIHPNKDGVARIVATLGPTILTLAQAATD